MDNNRASNAIPKLWNSDIGRRAFQRRRRFAVRQAGVFGRANVGISNDKGGEKPPHRKTKVSRSTLIGSGLVGT